MRTVPALAVVLATVIAPASGYAGSGHDKPAKSAVRASGQPDAHRAAPRGHAAGAPAPKPADTRPAATAGHESRDAKAGAGAPARGETVRSSAGLKALSDRIQRQLEEVAGNRRSAAPSTSSPTSAAPKPARARLTWRTEVTWPQELVSDAAPSSRVSLSWQIPD